MNALPETLDEKKALASAWFAELRDRITAALESVEDGLPAGARFADQAPGRFVRTPWKRTDHEGGDGGGGTMAFPAQWDPKLGIHVT